MTAKRVTTIVLNWNGLDDTLACLQSLARLTYANHEVVVVDNGSTDRSPDRIQERFPDATVLCNATNEGFCGGNNRGIRQALNNGADFVWLLNNDCEVEPDALSRLVVAADASPDIGLASPVVFYFGEKSRAQFSGSVMDPTTLEIVYPDERNDPEEPFQTGPNVALWGTALLVKRALIERIGLLDERLFAYWEDVDYSWRSLKAGFRNVVCPEARVYHKRQITPDGEAPKRSPTFYYLMERNQVLVRRRLADGAIGKMRFWITSLANASSHTRRAGAEYSGAVLQGAWHGLLSIGGPYRERPRMPTILRWILLAAAPLHPVFAAHVVTLNLSAIRRASRRWNVRRRA